MEQYPRITIRINGKLLAQLAGFANREKLTISKFIRQTLIAAVKARHPSK